jgi:hypothetical protein
MSRHGNLFYHFLTRRCGAGQFDDSHILFAANYL